MSPRIFVDAWEPEYGSAFAAEEMAASAAHVDPSVEVPAERWEPIPPERQGAMPRVAFVDGVRRVDALVWIEEGGSSLRRGLCASYAAGVVATSDRAEIGEIRLRRQLITACSEAAPLATKAGIYAPEPAPGESLSQLLSALQERLRRLEIEVALLVKGVDLLVVDGPLSTHHAREGVLGYVKSHHVSYLPPELERIVGRLQPFERTPLFLTTTSYRRYSSYLRLGGERSHPFSGVVRIEVSPELPFSRVQSLAGIAASALPRYASVPHKEPRAPQNLFPIGALERELRRRLGDHAIVHRALRVAAAALR